MWKTGTDRAYPFRHKHPNHFPPSPASNDRREAEVDDTWSYQYQYQLTPSPFNNIEEFPIVFRRPSEIGEERTGGLIFASDTMSPSRLPASQQSAWPLISTPLLASRPPAPPSSISTPPPPALTPLPVHTPTSRRKPRPSPPSTPNRSFSRPLLLPPHLEGHKDRYVEPPIPSAQAPQNVPGLLTDVLSIMNSIMSQQALVASENELLEDLTGLVVILQEEAEEMLMMADLVEEYSEEIKGEVETGKMVDGLEAWAEDLGLELGITGVHSLIEDYRAIVDDERNNREWEEECGQSYQTLSYDERRRKREAGIQCGGLGREREDLFDSALGMNMLSEEERDCHRHVGELRLSPGLQKPMELPREMERKAKAKEGKSKSGESGSPSKRSKKVTTSNELVRVDKGVGLGSLMSRKGREKVQSPFRDSGLDMASPRKSPWKTGSPRKPPRWI